MKTFAVHLRASRGADRFDEVAQFIAADNSGNFGLLAGHAPLVAVLRYGLARFVDRAGRWRYLALPGGVLNIAGNCLTVTTVRYFLGDESATICSQLAEEMARADSDVHTARATLNEIEHALVRRLGELSGRFREGIGE